MKKTFILSLIASTFMFCGCANSAIKNNNGNFDIIVNDSRKVEIIFDAGEGYFNKTGLHAQSMRILKGYTWGAIKASVPGENDITYGESRFNCWLDSEGKEPLDTLKFDDSSKPYVFTAKYDMVTRAQIKLDYNGGTFKGENIVKIDAYVGENWGKYAETYEDNNTIIAPGDNNVFSHFTYKGERVPTDFSFNESTEYTFTANYVNNGFTSDFATDNWTNFKTAIEKGFAHISQTSEGPNGGYAKAFSDNKNTFVGLTRTIHMYNDDYKVRVIGQNIDTLSNGTTGKTQATLTFQFVDAVEIGLSWCVGDYSYYEDSELRYYLNNQFINALPDDVISAIQPVKKRTYIGGGPDTQVITFNDKIFSPSLNELGITTFTIGGMQVTAQHEGFGVSNTEAYAYYNDPDTATNRRIFNYYPNHSDKTKYDPVEYWVRSTDDEANGYAWYISKEGTTPADGSYSTNYGLAIVPCFAVGVSSL